jgi:hypothetical protein
MLQLLTIEIKAWLKHPDGTSDVIRILPDPDGPAARCYLLFIAYEAYPGELGRILFDEDGYWIYDGNELTIDQQEQIAKLIMGLAVRK